MLVVLLGSNSVQCLVARHVVPLRADRSITRVTFLKPLLLQHSVTVLGVEEVGWAALEVESAALRLRRSNRGHLGAHRLNRAEIGPELAGTDKFVVEGKVLG